MERRAEVNRNERQDADGYRPNVGIIIVNDAGRVLLARRVGGGDRWQFPQGGIRPGETAKAALYRELREEVGLRRRHVARLGATDGWLRYRLPAAARRPGPDFVGQKQKWFLLRLLADGAEIRLDLSKKPEFDSHAWVSYWYPLHKVASFKRKVYRRALTALAPCLPRLTSSASGPE